ncbi:MAG: hypothetical protein J0L93_10995 [Deltaproteobacteria bacterium]|nr:hypothetical protein [Deltaproteobacteria bacterium]
MRIGFKAVDGLVLGVGMILSAIGCAESSTSVSFNIRYDSSVSSLVSASLTGASTPLYVRMFYTFDGLNVSDGNATYSASVVQPIETAPLTAVVGSGNSAVTRDNWATAQNPGPIRVGVNEIELIALPLGHTNTQMAIEFTQARTVNVNGASVVQYYVVAAGCLTIPEKLTKEVLQSYLGNPITMERKRTCGNCTKLAATADVTSFCTN